MSRSRYVRRWRPSDDRSIKAARLELRERTHGVDEYEDHACWSTAPAFVTKLDYVRILRAQIDTPRFSVRRRRTRSADRRLRKLNRCNAKAIERELLKRYEQRLMADALNSFCTFVLARSDP